MSYRKIRTIGLGTAATVCLIGGANAGDFSSSASYNAPFGMQTPQENQAVDPSLRDANGNLTLVNGQFTSSAMAQAYSQSGASAFSSGVGTAGTGASFAGATAIANSLNVITTGNNNTVVVNATQSNSGNVTATVNTGSH